MHDPGPSSQVLGGLLPPMSVFDHLPAPIQSLARALAPMVVYRSDEPLTRLEWVDAPDFTPTN